MGLMELEIMTFVMSVPIPIPFPFPIPMPRLRCWGLQMDSLKETWNKKIFSIAKSIKFYSFVVKAIVTKNVECYILWKHSPKKRNVIKKIRSCGFDESKSKVFQTRSYPKTLPAIFLNTWTKGKGKTKGMIYLPRFNQT